MAMFFLSSAAAGLTCTAAHDNLGGWHDKDVVLHRISSGSHVEHCGFGKVRYIREKKKKQDRLNRERQIAYMIYE